MINNYRFSNICFQEYNIFNDKEVIASIDSLNNITQITKNERGCTTHIARFDSNYNLLTETTYIYTGIGELIEVIDATDNKITSTYDLAGRRLTLESKDTGLRTWEYDSIGNVIEESNSVLREKEQSIAYHYDAFGRLIFKDYPNLKDTIYTYGKSTDANFAGRLIKREDSSGSISYEYGKLGEITKESRTLESFINYMDVGQFVTKEFEYKSNYLGQIEEITYPDGEVVTYLKDKWSLAKNYNWNGVYDWDAMTSNPDAKNVSKIGKIGIGALMYEIAEGCKSKYSLTGTNTNMQDRIKFLRNNGYNCDDEKCYSYNKVSDSLHRNCPVMVRGSNKNSNTGHAWIIDGSIELKRSRDYYVFWIPFPDNEYQSYVHCNYGWSGNYDEGNAYNYVGTGYYKSGVFQPNLERDYSYNLRIATNIRPKR